VYKAAWIFFILLFFGKGLIYADEGEDLLKIEKINGEVVFDGICDEPAYDYLVPLPVKMYRPNHGSEPTERSEIFITFDDEYLYMVARLYYSNGGVIRATTKKRDGAEGGMVTVAIGGAC